jgi:hypothetical protein
MKLCLFDPGFSDNDGSPSANLGDLIIQEAVLRELSSLFFHSKIIQVSTHSFPTNQHIFSAMRCPLIFVGGTNLLNAGMDRYQQWKISPLQMLFLNRAILFGVGWQQYQVRPNFYTRNALRTVLSNKWIHSVRDNYTKEKLLSAGIKNVVNTNCPTMWPLLNLCPEEIPAEKSDNLLMMLTNYRKNPELDLKLLQLATSKYERVFLWPQGKGDKEYISELSSGLQSTIILLEHSFKDFQGFLRSDFAFDYIGTRLHGGIKCLLARRRSLILEVDNRAKEIAKDTNLPTVDRSDFQKIIRWIETPSRIDVRLNLNEINLWKSQFKKFALASHRA